MPCGIAEHWPNYLGIKVFMISFTFIMMLVIFSMMSMTIFSKDSKVSKWTSSRPGSGGGVALEINHQNTIVEISPSKTSSQYTHYQHCKVHLLRMLATSDRSGMTEIT